MAISVRLLGKTLSSVSNEDLAHAYQRGLTLGEIAAQLRCSATTIHRRLLGCGVEMRQRGPQPR